MRRGGKAGFRRWGNESEGVAASSSESEGQDDTRGTTCNGDWPEIRSKLRPGQTFTDIPVVVCRVFKQKLSRLMSLFRTMFPNAGNLLYSIQRIEFQKRGLPHAHTQGAQKDFLM